MARDGGSFGVSSSGRSGKKWSDSGDILNVEPIVFWHGLDVEVRKRKESKLTDWDQEDYNWSTC